MNLITKTYCIIYIFLSYFTHLATAATNQSTHKCYIFPLRDATTWFRLRDHLSRFTCWLCLTSKTWFIYFQIYSLQKRSQTMVYHFHVPPLTHEIKKIYRICSNNSSHLINHLPWIIAPLWWKYLEQSLPPLSPSSISFIPSRSLWSGIWSSKTDLYNSSSEK